MIEGASKSAHSGAIAEAVAHTFRCHTGHAALRLLCSPCAYLQQGCSAEAGMADGSSPYGGSELHLACVAGLIPRCKRSWTVATTLHGHEAELDTSLEVFEGKRDLCAVLPCLCLAHSHVGLLLSSAHKAYDLTEPYR